MKDLFTKKGSDGDETIHDFIKQRFGHEVHYLESREPKHLKLEERASTE
jgi:hypothetical protein